MSNRRNFFKQLGGGIGMFLLSDKIITALERSPNTESTIKGVPEAFENVSRFDPTNSFDTKLTNGFFKYLRNNNVGFRWERAYSPVFELKNDEIKQVNTRKLQTNYFSHWKDNELHEIYSESFSGLTSTYYKPKTEEEYHEYLYRQICSELRKWRKEKYYIYQLNKMPMSIIDPTDFNTINMLIIRTCS